MSDKTSEKTGACELCGLDCALEKHHLVPVNVSRSNKYPKSLKTDESNFLWICGECHDAVHAAFTNQELRDLYSTKEKLLESEPIRKFVSWRIRHPGFKGSSKMSNANKRKRR